MGLYASASEGSKPIEEGTYVALCYGLVDLGDVYSEKFNKCSNKCLILWELDGETITVDDIILNRTVSKSYTLSLNEKSNLRKDLRAWRGREFTPEELKRFDVKNILGAPCQIQIVHSEKDGKTYAKIAGIMALPKGMKKPERLNKMIYWDFEENTIEDEMWNAMPEWAQERIKESETYKFIADGVSENLSDSRKDEIMAYKSYTKMRGFHEIDAAEEDGDLPF